MIRMANLQDYGEIIKLYNKNSKELGRYFKSDIVEKITSNQWYLDVENDKIVAFCSYTIKKRLKRIVIEYLCVDKEYRHNHKATNLIQRIMDDTSSMGLPYYAECLSGLENNSFYDKVAKLVDVRERPTYKILIYQFGGKNQ